MLDNQTGGLRHKNKRENFCNLFWEREHCQNLPGLGNWYCPYGTKLTAATKLFLVVKSNGRPNGGTLNAKWEGERVPVRKHHPRWFAREETSSFLPVKLQWICTWRSICNSNLNCKRTKLQKGCCPEQRNPNLVQSQSACSEPRKWARNNLRAFHVIQS